MEKETEDAAFRQSLLNSFGQHTFIAAALRRHYVTHIAPLLGKTEAEVEAEITALIHQEQLALLRLMDIERGLKQAKRNLDSE